MNIELINPTNTLPFNSTNTMGANQMEFNQDISINPPSSVSNTDTEIQQEVDEASGLLEMIVMKLSGEVLRDIPTDEYTQLVSLLDGMVSGSIDKQV